MSLSVKKILVTGAAGFIGYHVSRRLLSEGHQVTGLDNLNDYYDVQLKIDRLGQLKPYSSFKFVKVDLANDGDIAAVFASGNFDVVINLAAQAGVRHSLQHPHVYIDSNIRGFLNVLEGCRHNGIKHLLYASSSSVYGANTKMPFSIHDNIDHPLSLYAATKKSNELMAHSYSSLFNLPTTGLRFFSAYGPWGRPDMALYIFTKAILEGKPIDVYNGGKMKRDFTYIDDIVDGLVRLIPGPSQPNPLWSGMEPDPATSFAPYRVFNIGNNRPIELLEFIELIEQELGRPAIKNFMPIQAGDVDTNFADIDDLTSAVGYQPKTSIAKGVKSFVDWYKSYNR